MANRAYLYFCDDISALTFEMHYKKTDGGERSYMDSRHQFPLAWFLFFEPASVQMVPDTNVPYDDWFDNYLARPWAEARAAFERRAPLLLSWFRGEFTQPDVDEFLRRVQSLQEAPEETWLVADPYELGVDDEIGARRLRETLEKLADPELSVEQKLAVLEKWTQVEPIYNLERRLQQRRDAVFGFYYGQPIPGTFLPRVPWPAEDAGQT